MKKGTLLSVGEVTSRRVRYLRRRTFKKEGNLSFGGGSCIWK